MSTPEAPTTTSTETKKAPISRRRKKAEGRKKRIAKLQSDKEFAKKFHAEKSKRSAEKKSAFRKKKSKKK